MDATTATMPRTVRRRSGWIEKIRGAGGRIVWRVTYFDVDGRRRREATDATTKQLARRILAERQNAVEQARLQRLGSVRELLAPAPAVTVRAFVEEYLKHIRAHCSPETARRNDSHLKTYLLPRFGSMSLSEVTAGHVQRYADDRLAGPARGRGGKRAEAVDRRPRPSTVRGELMTLSGLFREATKACLLDRNPVALVRKPKVENQIVRYLDSQEETRLLAFAPEPLRSAIIVSIHSGLREGELVALTWADVRFPERSLVVRRSKNGSFRVVPMSETLFRTLQAIPRHLASSHVFTTAAGEPYQRFNSTLWRAVLGRAGIKAFRWHDLRHTFGSRLAQAGEPLLAIKELMGHRAIAVTMRYAHMAPSNLRTAVLALDRVSAGADMVVSAPRSAPATQETRQAAGA